MQQFFCILQQRSRQNQFSQQKMNNYTIISKLGQGAFATVYKVKRKEDGEQYAMKKIRIMSLGDKEISNCLNEVRILASLQSKYIVGYKDSFFDDITNTFCIITEYLPGGDLHHLITEYRNKKCFIPQDFIIKVAAQLISGLKALHEASILHRDIKPANVFLTSSKNAKLGDMNVSIVSSNGLAKTQTGTPYYASPQVWMQRTYNSKCDVWSLGCLLYQLATLKPPFSGGDMRTLKKSIIAGTFKNIPKGYSQELNNLISSCLKTDPKQRPSAKQLLCNQILMNKITQNLDQSTFIQGKMLDKINAPKRHNFRIVKDRLPRSRFLSQQRSNGLVSDRDKQNIPHIQRLLTQKLTRKSTSTSHRRLQPLQKPATEKQKIIDRPPLPKSKMLRA